MAGSDDFAVRHSADQRQRLRTKARMMPVDTNDCLGDETQAQENAVFTSPIEVDGKAF